MTNRRGWQNTHRRILEAAAEVFSRNGYARSTTRLIAQEAQITEVTLFRHFESKEKLFASIVESYGGKAVAAELEKQLTGDYRADLLKIGNSFLSVVLDRQNLIRMMLCEAAHFPELASMLSENPRLLRQMLARYLGSQIRRGRVRSLDPESAAHAFWSMFFTYGLTVGTYADPVSGELSPEQVVEHFVDVFINGTVAKE